MDEVATQLINKVQDHFKSHRSLVNMMDIFNDIPFIAWWLRDMDGKIIESSKQVKDVTDSVTKEQYQQFYDITAVSDKYAMCNYELNGLRRPSVFYEVLEIPDCDIRGVWKITKIVRPIDEFNIKKCQIFSLAYIQDIIHGSFEDAYDRLQILIENNMVTKISDRVYINKSKGHY